MSVYAFGGVSGLVGSWWYRGASQRVVALQKPLDVDSYEGASGTGTLPVGTVLYFDRVMETGTIYRVYVRIPVDIGALSPTDHFDEITPLAASVED